MLAIIEVVMIAAEATSQLAVTVGFAAAADTFLRYASDNIAGTPRSPVTASGAYPVREACNQPGRSKIRVIPRPAPQKPSANRSLRRLAYEALNGAAPLLCSFDRILMAANGMPNADSCATRLTN